METTGPPIYSIPRTDIGITASSTISKSKQTNKKYLNLESSQREAYAKYVFSERFAPRKN